MNQVQTNHPSAEQLASFSRGQLEDPMLTKIAQHLGQCDSCSAAMMTIPEDRLSRLVKDASRPATMSDRDDFEDRSADFDEQIPSVLRDLDRYRVVERIGRGGIGVIFRAEHKLMQRMVAIKVISQKLTQNPEAVTRFRNEVRAAASLSHPNIVSSYDAENVGDLHFLVMELVDGVSLSQHVADNGVPTVEEAVDMIEQASRGLNVAFENEMVHRDIKPQNLMLTKDGTVKILDFGLARIQRQPLTHEPPNENTERGGAQALIATSAGITGTNLAMGTPDYLAPEQARDATHADTRSDIYSLGGTFYFLLTGQPLYPEGNAVEKISQHLLGQPRKLGSIRDGVPTPVVKLVERMIEKDPESRFQNPAELLEAIAEVKAGIGMVPHRTRMNRRWFIGAAAIALPAMLAAAVWMMQPPKQKTMLVVAPTRPYFPDYESVKLELDRRGISMVTAASGNEIDPVSEVAHERFESDLLLSDVKAEQFDAIVFIGGHIAELTEGVGESETRRIISDARKSQIPLGGICMGIDVLKNCNVEEVQKLVKNSTEERIATFDGIVTAVGTEDVKAFVGRLLELK